MAKGWDLKIRLPELSEEADRRKQGYYSAVEKNKVVAKPLPSVRQAEERKRQIMALPMVSDYSTQYEIEQAKNTERNVQWQAQQEQDEARKEQAELNRLKTLDADKARAVAQDIDKQILEFETLEKQYDKLANEYAMAGGNDHRVTAYQNLRDYYKNKKQGLSGKAQNQRLDAEAAKQVQDQAYFEGMRNTLFYPKYQEGDLKQTANEMGDRIKGFANLEEKVFSINAITEEDAALYRYLKGELGQAKADEYAEHLKEALKYRGGQEWAKYASDKPVVQQIYAVKAGADQFNTGIKQLFQEEAVPTTMTEYGSAQIRKDVGERSKAAGVLYDVLQTGTNLLPSVVVGAAAGATGMPAGVASALGASAMGASVYGNSYRQALVEGYSKRQAHNYAFVTAASETVMEYAFGGIASIGGKITGGIAKTAIQNIDNVALRIAANLGISMVGEGAEKISRKIISPVIRNITLDENNEFKVFTEEALYAAMLGAITAGVLGGGQTIHSNITTAQAGNLMVKSNNTDTLIEQATMLDPGTEAHKIATELQDGTRKQTNDNLGELYQAYRRDGGDVGFLSENAMQTTETARQTPEQSKVQKAQAEIEAAQKELNDPYTRMMPVLQKAAQQRLEKAQADLTLAKQTAIEQGRPEIMQPDTQPPAQPMQNVDFTEAGQTIPQSMMAETARYKTQAMQAEGATGAATVEQALMEQKRLQRAYDRVSRKVMLSSADKSVVEALLEGGLTLEDIKGRPNSQELLQYYEAKKAYQENRNEIAAYNHNRKARLMDQAADLLVNSDQYNDKKIGFNYEKNTMERNIYDIVPDKAEADALIEHYVTPVHENEAAKARMINEYAERMRSIGADGKKAGLNANERQYVHMLATEMDLAERYEKTGNDGIGDALAYTRKEMADLEKKGNLDIQKCKDAMPEVFQLFGDILPQLNDAEMRSGYAATEYRKNYVPNFWEVKPVTVWQKIAKSMGFRLQNLDLPTDIAGLTAIFKPGKSWFSHSQNRAGYKTSFDIYQAFDTYIAGAADVIQHTDDIQRLRSLDNAIRMKYSDEGTQKRIQEILADETLDPDQKQEAIEKLPANTHLSNFVQELTEYTNHLANKKSLGDRSMEKSMGRAMYAAMNNVHARAAANMIGGNISVALSNFIPLTQAVSQVNPLTLVKGMYQTVHSYVKNDGFIDQSTFLTNRKGVERLSKTFTESASEKLSIPFEVVDMFVAETLVRAKYDQNIQKGMDEVTALKEADRWTASVMADRSKGALPTLFHRKNPVWKAFTMFQVETNNQLQYLFKDVPRDLKEQGVGAIAFALLKMFVASWLYNELSELLIGRRVALDPINLVLEAIRDFQEVDNGDLKTSQAMMNTWENVADNIPFVGTFLGGEGGRIPTASMLPSVWEIGKSIADGESGESIGAMALEELKKPLYYFALPFGGGQIKKTAEGLWTVAEGGSYKVDKEGLPQLQFATDQTPSDYLQAGVFGKWALPEARKYVDKGFPIWSAKDTAAFKEAKDAGVGQSHFISLRDEFKDLKPIKDQEGKTAQTVNEQARRKLFKDSTLSPEQKALIDRGLLRQADEKDEEGNVLSYRTADYSSEAMFELSLISEETHKEAIEIQKDGVTPETYLKYVNFYKSEKASTLRRELFKDEGLTPKQKQSIENKLRSSAETPYETQVNYESDAQYILSGYGKDVIKDADIAYQAYDIPYKAYQKYYEHRKILKEAGGSVKKYVVDMIRGLGLNKEQEKYLIKECDTK